MTSALGLVWSLLRVRPVGIRSAVSLYVGYGLVPIVRLMAPRRFRSVGYLIPGRSKLTVSIAGVRARIRPCTSDLDAFALVLEPRTVEWFRVEEGSVFVDVGAHIGRYSLMAARYASMVIAVEPEASNFHLLNENIALNHFSNVVTFHLALSNTRGGGRLYVARQGDTQTSSLEPGWRKSVAGRRTAVGVNTETLDGLVGSLGLHVIDWLKIDVEGHEISVLEGGLSALAMTKRLILEVAQGNEEACRTITKRAGLDLVSVEQEIGTRVSNWLLVRRG